MNSCSLSLLLHTDERILKGGKGQLQVHRNKKKEAGGRPRDERHTRPEGLPRYGRPKQELSRIKGSTEPQEGEEGGMHDRPPPFRKPGWRFDEAMRNKM